MRLLRFFLPKNDFRSFPKDDLLLKKVADKYQLPFPFLKPVRNVDAMVFDYKGEYIIKITSTDKKSAEAVHQTALWQSYLSMHEPAVATVIPSASGNLSEQIAGITGNYTVVVCAKTPGIPVLKKDWIPDLIFLTGKLTGRLHALTKKYNHGSDMNHIADWRNVVAGHVSGLSKKYVSQKNRFQYLMTRVNLTEDEKNRYGVVHNDIHRGNLTLANNKLHLFDFDDTCRTWFINDIAGIYYNTILDKGNKLNFENKPLVSNMEYFWRGYNIENRLSAEEMKLLPVFIALRAISGFAYLYRIGGSRNFNPTHRAYYLLSKKLSGIEFEIMPPEQFT